MLEKKSETPTHKRLDSRRGYPNDVGLYSSDQERESCGVGFVANIRGEASHQLMQDAYHLNSRMDHRGGCGFEENTGDGAGILTAIPHEFFKSISTELGFELPAKGRYAVGNIFLPTDFGERSFCKESIEKVVGQYGQEVIAWRKVPTESTAANIGPAALDAMPEIEQLFVGSNEMSSKKFERALYIIRKSFTAELRQNTKLNQCDLVYACTLSSKTIVYKGMLTPSQVFPFYPDLNDPRYATHLAMVHSRFSTNTFPSWDRAQPNRYISHNGEINTLRGNKNQMAAREGNVYSDLFGKNVKKLFPIIEPDCSDSGSLDNVLEFLMMSGRSLQESVVITVPEAWQSDPNMDSEKKAFYEFHSALMEPWDGPASIAFCDGDYIGAVLDRNGLRPSRYYITHDDRVIMASEVGVLAVEPSNIKFKGRLQPGKMFLIDFEKGRMVPDDELKQHFAQQHPYSDWLSNQVLNLEEIVKKSSFIPSFSDDLLQRMQAFGYTVETMEFMLIPLVNEARDPLGSMGNDSALACLSEKSRMSYDYFKQLFAQITNPPIDSIREEVVMSLECFVGPEQNVLGCSEKHANRLKLKTPILSNEELNTLKNIDYRGWKSKVIDITFEKKSGPQGMMECIHSACASASEAIAEGYSLIILSDKELSADRMALSSLIACGAVHHHLVNSHERARIGIIVESGEAREVHHHCLLTGYGADAINPYIAFESLLQAREDGLLEKSRYPTMTSIVDAYKKGVAKGMLKVMAKMGISTLQSYKGAQIFEAVGLADDIISLCFVGTASRVQGVDFNILFEEMSQRHELGFPQRDVNFIEVLPNPGDFHWRRGGETHMWDPKSISNLQVAARTNDQQAYWDFAKHANEHSTRSATFRGLLRFKKVAGDAIPLEVVEPASEIVKRFCTGAMSLGSISSESHEALAIAMNRLGGKSNTGEGGEDERRFTLMANGDSKRSAIKQVASGRFGVTMWYLANSDEIQIKIVQGAKPGEGGELPGGKVDETIAKIRYSTPGVGLISPPPHHDVYSIEDIAQLIHDLKNCNPDARISVKLGSEIGVGTIAAGVTKAKTDHLVIAGHDGGTGASPLTSIKHAGLPWELGIAETHQTLVMNNLRSRVVLQTDGQIKTGRDAAIAILLGAEEIGLSTAPLVTLGCIMMRKCHLNTCPVGIATQDADLRKKFSGQPEHVVNYLFMVAEEMRLIMADLGLKTVDSMVGRVDLLDTHVAQDHWKSKGVDLSKMLAPAKIVYDNTEVRCVFEQDHGLDKALDHQIIKLAKPALELGQIVELELPIVNTNRVVGTMLSHKVAKVTNGTMLKDDTIKVKLVGSAGQSLGAWLVKGVTLQVDGDANDYVGKGLSGGKIIIRPPRGSTFIAEKNIILGNVALYGATSGEAYFRGIAAERFCVRNSGAKAVVEGVGDHGCEYMTGGRVAILGRTGRNFGAGMSGGIAYVWDRDGDFPKLCNTGTLELEQLEDQDDIKELKSMIRNHLLYTGSDVARKILADWDSERHFFSKVMPTDYKRVLSEIGAKIAQKQAAG
tara:strand:- start:9655 stop:14253 length:4599 start_codon:yes stop_codon:yes gene_type:complete